MGRILESRHHQTSLFANKLTNNLAGKWNLISKYWNVKLYLLKDFLEIQIKIQSVSHATTNIIDLYIWLVPNDVVFQVYSSPCFWWQLYVIWVPKGVSSNAFKISDDNLESLVELCIRKNRTKNVNGKIKVE